MLIREVEITDSEKMVKLLRCLDTETEFMLYEPNERDCNVENQKNVLKGFIESSSKTMFISENQKELSGFIVGVGGVANRTKHNLYIVIGIKQGYTGQKLGVTLFKSLEKWAIEQKFHRLELTVMSHNERAIKLYKSLGYIEEGLKHHSIKLGSEYIDEISMYKLI